MRVNWPDDSLESPAFGVIAGIDPSDSDEVWLVFDGNSLVIGPTGEVVARGASFEQDIFMVELNLDQVFHERLLDCLSSCFGDVPELARDGERAARLRERGGCCAPVPAKTTR